MTRLFGACLGAVLAAGQAMADVRLLDWADLNGWAEDDHATAWRFSGTPAST